LRNPIDFVLKT